MAVERHGSHPPEVICRPAGNGLCEPLPLRAAWKPGDRVRLLLPDARLPHKRRRWFCGTVREVDPPGLRPGVRVDLDERVNGVQDCFATHAELQRP